MVSFNLDGTTSTFDRYAVPPYRCGVPWFGQSGLADTKHTLTVTFNGNSPENNTAGIGFLEWMWLECVPIHIHHNLQRLIVLY